MEERMAQAKKGDKVKIHYTGRLQDGTVFDSSEGRVPLEFTVGSGQVVPGFEEAVEGMEPGEQKTATIDAAKAYGARREELIVAILRQHLPDGMDPGVGETLALSTEDGQVVHVRVAGSDADAIVVDANHPLAGEDLTFDIELVSID
jgi:peptidylprolyl isomerase